MTSLSPSNPCVQTFLTQALQAHPTGARGHAVFEEFDCCTYELEHNRDQPEVCTVSLVTSSPAPPGAVEAIVQATHLHGVATAVEPAAGFQLSLKVSLSLSGQDHPASLSLVNAVH